MARLKDSWSPGSSGAVAFLTSTVVVAAHLRVEAAGPAYRGLLLPVDRVFDVSCAVAVIAVAWAIGLSTLRRVDFSLDSPIERLLFATPVGIGIQGTSVLVLGAASLLEPWALGALGLLLVWGARDSLGELREELRRIAGELQGGLGRWGLVALGVVAAFLMLQSATPPTDWDVLTYHLDVPWEFLNRGEVFLPEDNHHAAFVGLVHMLYVPLLAVGAESAPAILSTIVALLLSLTMYAVGARIFNTDTGRLASVLLWGSPAIFLVAVTARVDVTVTWLLVLAHFAVVVCLERRETGGWWWMAAVLIGLAVATKLSALAYVAGLAPVMVWVVLRERDRWTGSVLTLLGFGTLAGLVAAPWLVKNALLLGAPLYPYLAELRLEPWLVDYLGTLGAPASIDPNVFQIPALTREPFSVVALFTDPASLSPEGESDFYFANFVLLLLPLALLGKRLKSAAFLVPPLLYSAVVLVADSWINLRYLIPLFVMGTLVACYGVTKLGRALFSKSTLQAVWYLMVVAICLLPVGFAIYYKVSQMHPHQHWLGLRSESAYLESNSNPDVYVHARLRRWINERLPHDARIVMLFEARGFGFDPHVRQDNLFRSWPILATGHPWRDCLAPSGATHVLVNYGALGSLIQRGLDTETVRWSEFGKFARRCLEREGHVGRVVLYRIASEHLAGGRDATAEGAQFGSVDGLESR